MTKRMDIVVARKNGDKNYYSKIGAAFQLERGGWKLVFDALPCIPDDRGQITALLFEPREDDGRGGGKASPSLGGGPLNDDVPF